MALTRAVRKGTGLPGEKRYYRICSRICSFRRIRNDHVVRASMAEDSHAGYNGSAGGSAKRVNKAKTTSLYDYWSLEEHKRKINKKIG